MHREIRFAIEQRGFEFFREKSLRQIRAGQRGGLKFVAGRLDDLDFERLVRKRSAALSKNHVGLS
jgi:hypothetical protein